MSLGSARVFVVLCGSLLALSPGGARAQPDAPDAPIAGGAPHSLDLRAPERLVLGAEDDAELSARPDQGALPGRVGGLCLRQPFAGRLALLA